MEPFCTLSLFAFQPALPMRGVTDTYAAKDECGPFQPALPMQGVTRIDMEAERATVFQPALPMRGVTCLCHPQSLGR